MKLATASLALVLAFCWCLGGAFGATCSWAGHCEGAPCKTYKDCSDSLVCVAGKCASGTPAPTPKPTSAPTRAPTSKPTAGPTTAPTSSSSGCPAGWMPAIGSVYESWPKPGSSECIKYDGCKWAGMFNNIDGGSSERTCKKGAQWMSGGSGSKPQCRFPDSLVKQWSMASTWEMDNALLNKQLKVMVQGAPTKTVTVNVLDVCSDKDCNGCCKDNTGNKKYKLIDLEKWPASSLLGFDPNNIDVNTYNFPRSDGLRPGAPAELMPLCYQVVGNAISV